MRDDVFFPFRRPMHQSRAAQLIEAIQFVSTAGSRVEYFRERVGRARLGRFYHVYDTLGAITRGLLIFPSDKLKNSRAPRMNQEWDNREDTA